LYPKRIFILNVIPIRYGKSAYNSSGQREKKSYLYLLLNFEPMSPSYREGSTDFILEDELGAELSPVSSSQLLTAGRRKKRFSAELHDDIAAKLAAIKFSRKNYCNG
jgi:hypothetical protein